MNDKQQTGLSSIVFLEPLVEIFIVEGRYSSLSRTRCSNNQIFVIVTLLSFVLQFLQHLYLVCLANKTSNNFWAINVRCFITSLINGLCKTPEGIVSIYRFKCSTIPIRVKRSLSRTYDVWILYVGHSHIPFQSLCQC